MRRALLAFLTFGVVLAAVAGFAATMGIGGSSLGAGDGVVAACDDVNVAWGTPSWDAGTSKFVVSSVTITENNAGEATPTNACDTKGVSVRVGSATASGTMSSGSASLNLSSAVPAESVSSVNIVVG